MRHGQAELTHPDAERHLTREGAAAVERVAARAAVLAPQVDHVYHSGFARSRETAEILARHLNASDHVAARDGLAPDDPVDPVARWLLDQAGLRGKGATVLAGHLPFLARLASRLVAGDAMAQVVAFEPAVLAKLVPKREREGYSIAWVLSPELD